MAPAFAARDGAQKPEIGGRKCVGLTQLPERNILRGPFTHPTNGAEPLHGVIKAAIAVEQMRVGNSRGGDGRKRGRSAPRHAERSEIGGTDDVGPREDMRQRPARGRQRLTMRGHHAAGEPRGRSHSDLLAEHSTNGEFEAVPGARHPQAGARAHQRLKRRIGRKMRGDG